MINQILIKKINIKITSKNIKPADYLSGSLRYYPNSL